MPKSRVRKGRKVIKVGATAADQRKISEGFQKKMVEFSGKTLEELKAIKESQDNKTAKKFGGAYQQAFEFALLLAEKKASEPQATGEETPIELTGLSATITPVEDIKQEEGA